MDKFNFGKHSIFQIYPQQFGRIALILICFFNLKPVLAESLPKILSPSGSGFFQLNVQMEYIDDPAGKVTIDQIITGQAGEFRPLIKKNYQFTYKNKAMWVRFFVDFSRYDDLYWYLLQNYEHVDELSIFFSDADGQYHSNRFIESSERQNHDFNIHQYLFKIPVLTKQPSAVYIRYEPGGHALNIDLSWADSKGVIENLSNAQLGLGLFFGGLAVMWVYNFLLFFYLRDRAYLYYLYYLGTFALTYLYITGLASTLIRYNTISQQFFAACAYASVHGMILFARHFLNLRNSLIWLNSYLTIFQWLLFIGIISCFFLPTSVTFDNINYLILMIIPVLVVCGGMRVYQGYQPANLYFTGWTILGIGLALQALRSIDFLPSNFITNYAIQIAAVLEAVLFGLALANRVRLLEKDELRKSQRLLLELGTAIEKEKEAVRHKSLFIAAVNHELRTPLQMLTGSIEVLTRMAKSTPMEKFVNKISRASLQITAQMRDIGEYSRLEAGVLSERNGNFRVRELLTDVEDGFMKSASLKCIALTIKCANPEMELYGDHDRIQQILNNLVDNAIKFTARGTITVEGAVEEVGDHRLSDKPLLLIIKIVDTGTGIADEDLSKMFDPFVQVETCSENRGTGLGLAIVKGIVKLLDGDIALSSQLGAGTQVLIRIPVDRFRKIEE